MKDCIHLILRGRRAQALVQDDEDWQALSGIAERMLFWCGGAIHGCRCAGNEMRFAVEPALASIGSRTAPPSRERERPRVLQLSGTMAKDAAPRAAGWRMNCTYEQGCRCYPPERFPTPTVRPVQLPSIDPTRAVRPQPSEYPYDARPWLIRSVSARVDCSPVLRLARPLTVASLPNGSGSPGRSFSPNSVCMPG